MSDNVNRQPQRRGGMMMGPGGRGGGPGGRFSGEKPKDFKGTVKRLLSFLSPYRFSIMIVIILAAASSAFAIVGPDIMGKATTKLFNGVMEKIQGVPGASIDLEGIGRIIVQLIILYVVSALFSYVQHFIMSGVGQKATYNMRDRLSKKIKRLPLSYFDKQTHGEVLSRVTNDVDTVSMSLNQVLSQVVTSVATIIGVLIMMFKISWLMTLVTLLILPISVFFASFIVKRSQKYFRSQQKTLGQLNGHIEEMYGGHIIMKAFNGEKQSVETFTEHNSRLYDSAWKSQFFSGLMFPLMTFVGNLGYVAVSVLGAWLAVKKTIEVGDIQAFIQYVRTFTMPITQMAQVSNMLQSMAAAAERVFEFLDEKEEEPDSPAPAEFGEGGGEVVFDHVRFGYAEDKIIINDFSAGVKPGQHIAIVGHTGAGKTTMVKLLMRFYDVNGGSIKVEGRDIREYRRNDLRSKLGMVLQDTWLFSGTIMENIRYGRLDATDEEVRAAARAAHADHFIRSLPDGYGFMLNEETTNISQGEKQLLTIARAILSDPKILILDEATSSVDTRTEHLIQKAMDALMAGRTSFVIAHRLSTIRNADLILVMENGDIVEQGSHNELLARDGVYAALYKSQFEKTA